VRACVPPPVPYSPRKPDAQSKAVRTAKPLRFATFPLGRLVVAPAGARRADSAGRESEQFREIVVVVLVSGKLTIASRNFSEGLPRSAGFFTFNRVQQFAWIIPIKSKWQERKC